MLARELHTVLARDFRCSDTSFVEWTFRRMLLKHSARLAPRGLTVHNMATAITRIHTEDSRMSRLVVHGEVIIVTNE